MSKLTRLPFTAMRTRDVTFCANRHTRINTVWNPHTGCSAWGYDFTNPLHINANIWQIYLHDSIIFIHCIILHRCYSFTASCCRVWFSSTILCCRDASHPLHHVAEMLLIHCFMIADMLLIHYIMLQTCFSSTTSCCRDASHSLLHVAEMLLIHYIMLQRSKCVSSSKCTSISA